LKSPKDVAEELRQIAAKLDRSENPSRVLVASELRSVLASVGTNYLAFTSGSGTSVWELPPDADLARLQPLVEAYNSSEAWTARNGDGTAYLLDDSTIIAELSDEDIDDPDGEAAGMTPKELIHGVDQWEPADMAKAVAMLKGELDGLSGEPIEG
jgi:hypothetical protein